jgi:hypothetical protein
MNIGSAVTFASEASGYLEICANLSTQGASLYVNVKHLDIATRRQTEQQSHTTNDEILDLGSGYADDEIVTVATQADPVAPDESLATPNQDDDEQPQDSEPQPAPATEPAFNMQALQDAVEEPPAAAAALPPPAAPKKPIATRARTAARKL